MPGRLSEALGPLRERTFRRWFLSQILSGSGTATQAVGQSWLVVQLHGHGLALAAVSAAMFAPLFLFSAPLGFLIDHLDVRRLLVSTEIGLLVVACGLVALTALGDARLWSLTVGAALTGMIVAIDQPAKQIYSMRLTGDAQVGRAVSLSEVVFNASRVLGPAVGGGLLGLAGPWICFAVNAASYPPVLLVLWLERANSRHPERSHVRSWKLHDIAAGVRFSWRHPAVLTCLGLAVFAGIAFNLSVPMPLLAKRYFHVGGDGYGLMLAAFGVGALPGAVVAGARTAPPHAREVATLAVLAGIAVLIASCCPTFPTMLIALCAVGMLSIWFIARANAFVLLEAPMELRGRVASVWTLVMPGSYVFTAFVTGWISDAVNPRLAYSVAGIGLVTVAALCWRSMQAPALRSAPM